MDFTKRKKIFIFIGAQIIFVLLASILYRLFGGQLIEAMYNGTSLAFLNSLIQGQAEVPVLFYVFKADELFLKLFLFAVFFILFEIVIFAVTVKGFRRAFLVVGMLVLIPALYLLRYEHILHRLRDYDVVTAPSFKEKQFPKLKMNQVIMLGNAHTKSYHPGSSYLEYPRQKKPDITRIGIFGCSFVEGTEAAKGHDLPSLLQDKFDKTGIENIEVINFGVSSYGVHQMYLLWEFIGKYYDLDYVVFMPFSWHKTRDNTFIYASDSYGPIHARFIIKDGDTKLIPVLGTTRSEACKIYYRVALPWQYTRYDNQMPLFLKTLLPSALHKRSNPFYYKGWKSKRDEIPATYRILFERLSKDADNFIVIANDDEIYSLRRNIRRPNVYFMKSRAPEFFNFLYFAKGHNSALGNQMRADELFSFLTGYPEPKPRAIKLSCRVWAQKRDFIPSPRPLYKYNKIFACIGQHAVATFLAKRHYPYKDLDFQKYKIASLLLLTSGEDVRFATFVPLGFLLNGDEPVFLSFKRGNDPFRVPIGVINAQAGVLGKWELKPDKEGCFVRDGPDWTLEIKNANLFLEAGPGIKDICITAGGKKILKAVRAYDNPFLCSLSEFMLGKSALIFQPVISDFACLRENSGQFVDIDNLAEKEGTLDLVLGETGGQKERYPIFSYKVVPVFLSFSIPPRSWAI